MKKKAIFCGLVISLLLLIIVTAAASGYKMTYLPGTTDNVTNLPEEDEITNGDAYTVSSQIPEREGYEFIDWVLDYDVIVYTVTYVVNTDPTYGTPDGIVVPKDQNEYAPNDYVDVADQLTATVDYAYNEKGEKVKGTWEFTVWDKDDFEIYEDTTITGAWKFTPAPVKKYKYIVHYKLYEGSLANAKTVNSDTEGTVDALGTLVPIDAIAVKELDKKQYRNPKKYEIRPGFQHVDVKITHDNYEITIWYQPKSIGQ